MLTKTLDPAPKGQQITLVMSIQIKQAIRRIGRKMGIGRPATLDIMDLTPPDSDASVKALALVQSVSKPYLVNHCLRSYYFGAAMARYEGLKYDPELFYVACMLHDLGLTEAGAGPKDFELEGARMAYDFALQEQWAEQRAHALHESIALHTQMGLAEKRHPELKLVHWGAGMDVMGFHSEDVCPHTKEAVVAQYPRLNLKHELLIDLKKQVTDKPTCSMARMASLGFFKLIQQGPFSE